MTRPWDLSESCISFGTKSLKKGEKTEAFRNAVLRAGHESWFSRLPAVYR